MTLAALLGLCAALGYGVGDYLGGFYSRRHGILPVILIAECAGILLVLPTALLLSPPVTGPADLAWGALAGAIGVAGGYMLFHGFRVGRLSVVAPVSSLSAAGIPLLFDLLVDVSPPLPALAGMLVGLVAIWLISTGTPEPGRSGRSIAAGFWYGLGAGVGFAAMFLALSRSDPGSGVWPVVAAQFTVLVLTLLLTLALRQPRGVPLASLPGVAAVGIAGYLGTVCFLFAARHGLVSVAAVIASLSPGVTVVLARMFMAEQLPPRQLAGLMIAIVALVLIALG